VVVVEQEETRGPTIPVPRGKAVVKKSREKSLTTADLVLLSLLAEQPMHGYQANAELKRREIRDWAAISRPQVYYSLAKLARLGFLRPVRSAGACCGPERQRFAATRSGLAALRDALEREDWSTGREKPPFLTWMALSWQARKGVFRRQLKLREAFLERELRRERETLASVRAEVGHPYHEAVWMLQLMAAQFETELRWTARLRKELGRRARAMHPTLTKP
jgi:DNA-binding PadR family transcriptional regulator